MPVAEQRFLRSGKVRDLYAVDDRRLLLVASDRLSAFDVVLPTAVPDKGKVLTGLSRYWFRETSGIVPNHLLATDVASLGGGDSGSWDEFRGRAMICRRANVLPAEIVVRGFLAGSGWKDYNRTGAVCGLRLPEGLRESDRLPEPIVTPSTKADVGHDENIDFEKLVAMVGPELAERVREVALELYRFASARAEAVGLLVADTKFEFGTDPDSGELLLVDEALTPDSSRFWDAAGYAPGRAQPSFDKQYVRDWLEAEQWDKTPPAPELPPEIVIGTRARYVEAFERLTGSRFERYLVDDVVEIHDRGADRSADVVAPIAGGG